MALTIILPKEYPYVLLTAIAIAFLCYLTGFLVA